VRLFAKLDRRAGRGHVCFLLDHALRRGAAQQVELGPDGQHALVLLPLERVAQQRQQPRGRHHRDLAPQVICD